jgi:hypothetical protein
MILLVDKSIMSGHNDIANAIESKTRALPCLRQSGLEWSPKRSFLSRATSLET